MSFTMSEDFVRRAIANAAEDEQCVDLHSGSCNFKALTQSLAGVRSIAKIYFIVHLIPLLFGYKKTGKDPVQALKKLLLGFGKSMLFVAGTLFVIRRSVCLYTNLVGFSHVSTVYSGVVAGLPLLFESHGRRTEISLFCLNKAVQMVYQMLRRRHPSLHIPFGEGWLLALSAALLTYFFTNERQLFRSVYKSALDPIFKDI